MPDRQRAAGPRVRGPWVTRSINNQHNLKRLGKNHDGYHGERIEIAAVLQACAVAARAQGWASEEIPVGSGCTLPVFARGQGGGIRIYISAGIHGDEPAGPLAVLQLLQDNVWPANAEISLLPCLNPTGFPLNRRENAHGNDLNRDYRHFETAEVRAHVDWLKRQRPFDLTFCLHEDWESHGFYLYELNPEGFSSPAPAMIAAVSAVCPIDLSSVIEDREASGGIINPNLDPNSRPQWPEAFWLLQNKTRQSYTLEAPSDFPLTVRVAGLVAALRAALPANVADGGSRQK